MLRACFSRSCAVWLFACLLVFGLAVRASGDQKIADFEGANALSGWKFSSGGAGGRFDAVAGKGRSSSAGAVLSFDFTGGGDYVAATYTFPSAAACQGISFWLLNYVTGSALAVRLVDQTGQTIQIGLPMRNDVSGWVQYRVLTGQGDSHSGGANDGIFHGAMRGFTIVVSKGLDYYKTGSITFDDVSTITSRASEVDPFGADRLSPFFNGRIADLIGVDVHMIEPDERQLDLARQAGFGFVRMDLYWQRIETRPGIYDFSAYDRLLDALQSRNMGALFILDYSNPLYYDGPGPFKWNWGPSSDRTRAAYARFATAASSHYAGKNVILEAWNEPNIQPFWLPQPDAHNYSLLASRALAADEPGVRMLIGATSSVDAAYLDRIFSSGQLNDVQWVSIHPYRNDYPESFYQEAAVIPRIVARWTGRPVPVVNSEWGYSSSRFGGRSPSAYHQQAVAAVRVLLVSILRKVQKTVWYDLVDDGDKASNSHDNFGLIHNHTLEPKPAYTAVKAFHDLLPADSSLAASSIETHFSHVYGLLVSGSTGGQVAVLWSFRARTPTTLRIADRAGLQFYDMNGKPLSVPLDGNFRMLSIAEEQGPVYVRVP